MSKMHNRATRRLESILNPGSAQRSLRNMVRSLVERQRKLLLMRSMRRTKNLRRSQTTKRRSVSLRKSLRSLWTVQETRRRVRQLPSNLRKRARSSGSAIEWPPWGEEDETELWGGNAGKHDRRSKDASRRWTE